MFFVSRLNFITRTYEVTTNGPLFGGLKPDTINQKNAKAVMIAKFNASSCRLFSLAYVEILPIGSFIKRGFHFHSIGAPLGILLGLVVALL